MRAKWSAMKVECGENILLQKARGVGSRAGASLEMIEEVKGQNAKRVQLNWRECGKQTHTPQKGKNFLWNETPPRAASGVAVAGRASSNIIKRTRQPHILIASKRSHVLVFACYTSSRLYFYFTASCVQDQRMPFYGLCPKSIYKCICGCEQIVVCSVTCNFSLLFIFSAPKKESAGGRIFFSFMYVRARDSFNCWLMI